LGFFYLISQNTTEKGILLSDQGIYFDQRFDTSIEALLPLPFFHSCDAIHLKSILDYGAVKLMPCKEYGEDLLYTFYGKPGFKSSNSRNSRAGYLMPLCFIVRYEFVTGIHRAVAFDSGAYNIGLYKDHLHKSMKLHQFHLTPEKDSLRKMVQYFYESNEKYFVGEPKGVIDYDPLHTPIESYLSILRCTYQTEFDDRKGCLEAQLKYEIPIHKDAIEAVIMPSHLMTSPTVQRKIIDQGIPVLPVLNYGVAQGNYYVHVLELTRSFLVQNRLMKNDW
jgi:hypothetical protein